MEFTLEEIIQATNAKIIKNNLSGDEKFTLSTDTRTIEKGQIYLPLRGPNFDGEKFIDKAIEAGALGCFTEAKRQRGEGAEQEPIQASIHPDIYASLILEVADSLKAYLQLARFYKRKINPKTIAITGSSGKTTTKEMAYCVAREKFRTHKSELNFNNEIGLCKTILSMPEDTEVLILEMGMRGLGEIELLSKYSEPDISIIANVGTAHIGRLGSRENIAKAKCEIVKYSKDGGILIAHDDELIRMQRCKDAKLQSLYFSITQADILERNIGYSKFGYKDHQYELNIEGDYNVENALAVIEMGLSLGMQEAQIAEGLKKYSPIEKRWEVQEIKGYKIINDSYNANPDSMKGVIETVLDVYSPPLLLVLGNMGELGENEVAYHKEIGEFIRTNLKKDAEVLTVGDLAKEITNVLSDNGINSVSFENNLQISRYILDNVAVGTTIVLKASRSMKFEEILGYIKEN